MIAILFNMPLIFFLFFIIIIPLAGTFFISFLKFTTFLPIEFAGFDNYLRLIMDVQFIRSLLFTLSFSFLSVLLELILGMVVALLLNEKIPLLGLWRGLLLLPWIIPSVVSGKIWALMFNYTYGFLNKLLSLFSIEGINWLGSQFAAFLSLIIADVWRTTPFVALILLAGLQSIPEEILNQSKIDNAGPVKTFFYITLPLLKPFLLTALLFRCIDALRVFDIILVVTGGGPGGGTESLTMYAYKYYLMGDFGYGSTISVTLFILSFAISLLLLKLWKLD